MPTALESKAALRLLTDTAVDFSVSVAGRLSGAPEVQRAALLEAVPAIIDTYTDGSSALAADFYDDERLRAKVPTPFASAPIVTDRTVKIRRAVAWASEPLFVGTGSLVLQSRLAEVVQLEVARAFRDTITGNRRQDPQSVGWRRITTGGCRFCRMLADRGAIYRHDTARFAAHTSCGCTAQPVFSTNDTGEEASVLQYVASKKNRTPSQRAQLVDYLDSFY